MNLRTLSIREAHNETGIPIPTLRKLVESGKIAGNKAGKNYRVSVASLEAFVNHVPAAKVVQSSERAFPEVEDRFA